MKYLQEKIMMIYGGSFQFPNLYIIENIWGDLKYDHMET